MGRPISAASRSATTHSVIEDLSANCVLVDDPTQPVSVLGGQIQPLAYRVTCTAPPLTGPNRIAFQSDRDGFTEIYTMSSDWERADPRHRG